jgi:hypothetical protein
MPLAALSEKQARAIVGDRLIVDPASLAPFTTVEKAIKKAPDQRRR